MALGERDNSNLPALAAELVRRNVEIIVARTNLPTHGAMKATQTIPIVMSTGTFGRSRLGWSRASRTRRERDWHFLLGVCRSLGKHFKSSRSWRHARIASLLLRTRIPPVARWIRPSGGPQGSAGQLGMTVHYFDVRQPEDIGLR